MLPFMTASILCITIKRRLSGDLSYWKGGISENGVPRL